MDAKVLSELLIAEGASVAVAESVTGGSICAALSSVEGAGTWFAGGFVTYQMDQKTKILDVPAELFEKHKGAVNTEVTAHMARGAQRVAGVDYALAVSGYAGPTGGDDAPVGTVCFTWVKGEHLWQATHRFDGDRDEVRRKTVEEAIKGLINVAQNLKPDLA